MVYIICEQTRIIQSLFLLLYCLTTTFLCSLPVYKLVQFYSLCSSSFPFIGTLCVSMESSDPFNSSDAARARRARRKEVLRLKRDGRRSLYPSVVTRNSCQYNFYICISVYLLQLFCNQIRLDLVLELGYMLHSYEVVLLFWTILTVYRRGRFGLPDDSQGPLSLFSHMSGGDANFFCEFGDFSFFQLGSFLFLHHFWVSLFLIIIS